MANWSLDGARRWARLPKMAPDVEKRAAQATIAFLEDLSARIEEAVGKQSPEALESLHAVWDFESFPPEYLDFLLTTLGEGEVRIRLFGGEVKVGETGIPGLWRMQSGRTGEVNSFVLGRIPASVAATAKKGLEGIPRLVNPGTDVFAAPAILEELRHALEGARLDVLGTKPAYMVELTRQPLSQGDRRALDSTLGHGSVDVELRGFARSNLTLTSVRGIWKSTIENNAGKAFLDAYVVAGIPPEVPIAPEEFGDAVKKCRETIEWLRNDLDRGAIGGGD